MRYGCSPVVMEIERLRWQADLIVPNLGLMSARKASFALKFQSREKKKKKIHGLFKLQGQDPVESMVANGCSQSDEAG